jgi:hypothetical protein
MPRESFARYHERKMGRNSCGPNAFWDISPRMVQRRKFMMMIHPSLPHACGKTFATLALATVMAGCASFFNPVRNNGEPRLVRAVESPHDLASPFTEAAGPPVPVVALARVDLPNRAGEPTRVQTIVEPLFAPPTPTMQPPPPTTQPMPSIIIQSANIGDQYQIIQEKSGQPQLTITSPSGTGSIVIARSQDAWPATLTVKLQYNASKQFATLEKFQAEEVVDEQRRLKLEATINKTDGTAEIHIPAFVQSKQIAIQWVDGK